ncbi:MAG: hypothetical protein KHY47_13685, partial [Prevotella sp.]|nr:hypothetical protein [Prevotella sp.]
PLKTQKKKPKNLQKREIFHIFAEGKAALGNLKAAFIALVCITNILNYIIMLGTELPHVVQVRAEGPEAPSPG